LAKIKEEDELRERKKPSRSHEKRFESTIRKADERKIHSLEAITRICEVDSIPPPKQTTSASWSSSPPCRPSKPGNLDILPFLNEERRTDVFVTAFSGSLGFWVQLAANAEALKKLNEEMSNTYKSNTSSFYDFVNIMIV